MSSEVLFCYIVLFQFPDSALSRLSSIKQWNRRNQTWNGSFWKWLLIKVVVTTTASLTKTYSSVYLTISLWNIYYVRKTSYGWRFWDFNGSIYNIQGVENLLPLRKVQVNYPRVLPWEVYYSCEYYSI